MTERTDQKADSAGAAGSDPLRSALIQQGIMLGQQATQLNATTQEIGALNAQVAALLSTVEELRFEAAGRRPLNPDDLERSRDPEPHANTPPIYDGDPNACQSFLSQCTLVFALQPRRYASEEAKVAFVITLLSGRAREWGVAVWNARAPCCRSFEEFHHEMSRLFDRSAQGDEAAARLSRLSQGRSSVTDYAIRFQTLAAACRWNEAALRARFLEGLSFPIADELAATEIPRELEDIISLALRVEGRLALRRQLRSRSNWRSQETRQESTTEAPPSVPEPEPMQLGSVHLTAAQRQHRLKENLCFYCGKSGHLVSACPVKGPAHR